VEQHERGGGAVAERVDAQVDPVDVNDPFGRHRVRRYPRALAWSMGSSGYVASVEADVRIQSVDAVETRTGKTRYVVRDENGREYTTFRPAIGSEAAKFEGRRAHIEFHEQERNGFQNVYLDAISRAPDDEGPEPGDSTEPEEAAWRTAVDAAPWVLGTNEPDREVPPEELYEKLEPFKRLVADDIRHGGDDDQQ
jgi:hypothetical protein